MPQHASQDNNFRRITFSQLPNKN